MKFGSLLGITAPMILLAPLSVEQIKQLNEILNNKADSSAIQDFKSEISLINEVYSHRFRTSPVEPSEIRRFRSYKMAEKFWEAEYAKKDREKGRYVEPTPEQLDGKWDRETYENYKKNILPNLKIEYTTFRNIYGENSGKIYKPNLNMLGDLDKLKIDDPEKYKEVQKAKDYFSVVNRLSKGLRALDVANNSLVVNEFTEVTVFGYTLFTLLSKDSYYVQYKIISEIKNAKSLNIRQKLIDRLVEDIKLVYTLINAESFGKAETPVAPAIREVKRVLKKRGINDDAKRDSGSSSEYLDELAKEFVKQNPSYAHSKVLPKIIRLRVFNDISFETLDFLDELYTYVSKFDVEFYNQRFGLDYTKEDYIEMFNILEEYGIIGLNFEAEHFFMDSLESLHLTGTQENYTVERDSYLAKNASCLSQYCEALIPFGEEI